MLLNCQLLVDVDNKNEWRDCFDVSGVKLPTGLYFGASAATGQLAGIYKELTICLVYNIVSLQVYYVHIFEESAFC